MPRRPLPRRALSTLVAAGLLLLAGGGAATWLLIDIPFGPIFLTAFLTAALGLLLALAAGAALCLRRRGWPWRVPGALLAALAAVLAAALLILKLDYALLPGFDVKRGLTADQWRADLTHLAAELPRMHPALFELVPEADFRAAVTRLDRAIDSLDEPTIRAELARIVALPGDAHTMPNVFSVNLDWHCFPLAVHIFDDGVRIVDAGREQRRLVGSRILALDGTPVVDALDAVAPYLATESEAGRLERHGYMLTVAEWMHAVGVLRDPGRGVFTLEDEAGRVHEVALEPVLYIPVIYWGMVRKVDGDVTSIAVKNERRENYHFELLPDGTLYFQFNMVVEDGQPETLATFTERLGAFADAHDFERCVIDVRNNDGGNGGLLPPLVEFLAGHERINRPGRLFVLISRRTYSAAVMFTAMMQARSHAVLVGEPTPQGPVFYSSPEVLRLPDSGMEFLVSSSLTPASPLCDPRRSITPDVPVAFTWEDHVRGRDPFLAAARTYRHEPVPPAPAGAERLAGRYRYDTLRVLTVTLAGGALRLRLDDFLPGSMQTLDTALIPDGGTAFRAGVPGLRLDFPDLADPGAAVGEARLLWGACDRTLPRLAEGERLPLELIRMGRVAEGAAALAAAREVYRAGIPGLEAVLNGTGYAHLRDGRTDEAVAVFELNVLLYPESSNVYDSLGEGYLAAGREAEALANYRKSLELNPDNRNAAAVIERLGR
ncbi:MAG: hypothetical protein JW819_02820 [Candidatus Krumholzibacteriota bacterium]|nr:hypothetical protein [Candidatus Krumholzibacteriota bacterium]